MWNAQRDKDRAWDRENRMVKEPCMVTETARDENMKGFVCNDSFN